MIYYIGTLTAGLLFSLSLQKTERAMRPSFLPSLPPQIRALATAFFFPSDQYPEHRFYWHYSVPCILVIATAFYTLHLSTARLARISPWSVCFTVEALQSLCDIRAIETLQVRNDTAAPSSSTGLSTGLASFQWSTYGNCKALHYLTGKPTGKIRVSSL